METPITLHQIRQVRNDRLCKEAAELVAAVTKTVTREAVHGKLLCAPLSSLIEFELPYVIPSTIHFDEIRESCHQSLGVYLATVASPTDFAYMLYKSYRKKEVLTILRIAPRRRPWYRDFIDFPETNIMTTDLDRTAF